MNLNWEGVISLISIKWCSNGVVGKGETYLKRY